jgi:periplasmic divalent cation tolerance protein
MSDALLVLVTIGEQEAGIRLGHTLVEERLAACVQVIPGGTAIYRWEGQVHAEPQVQLIIKTSGRIWPELRARILALHSDEVPEILALPVTDGLPAYLDWLKDMTA